MAGFSARERMIAAMLSSMPGLKKTVKNVYVRLNAFLYRKPYRSKVAGGMGQIHLIEPEDSNTETFFGYYDKACERNGMLIYHRTTGQPTSKKPIASQDVEIVLRDMESGTDTVIGKTYSYNWQQGARTQWLDDRHVIYNIAREGRYYAVIRDIEFGDEEYLEYPVQDVLADGRYLSINYSRIMRLRPDYGYRNYPLPSDREMADMDVDGIFIVSPSEKNGRLLHSLSSIASVAPKPIFGRCHHVVNHLMGRPDGKAFIFIHRFYEGKRRHDRLMYSDFHSLRILADEDMVSHCCWIDNRHVLGYLRHNGTDAFYVIDVESGVIQRHEAMSSLNLGDGHPSVSSSHIAFDTYPDKSRMQHLFLLGKIDKTVREIAEVHHSINYMDECRCDMHPRFSADGRRLYFDTVFTGRRRLAYLDIEE